MKRPTRVFVVLCAWLSVAPNSRAAGGFRASGSSMMSSSHPSSQTRVTRPAPPLQRAPGGIDGHQHHRHRFPIDGQHHHHHRFPFFATAPIFFGSSFAYPYRFNYGFGSPYGFGWPYGLGSPYPFNTPHGFAMPYGLAEPGSAPAPIY